MSCVGPLAWIENTLWVADENFSRWLSFTGPFIDFMDAALEEGQNGFGGTFKSNQGSLAPNRQSHGGAVSRDPVTGALAAVDSNGGRVLIFNGPVDASATSANTILGTFLPLAAKGLPACVAGGNPIYPQNNGTYPPTESTFCNPVGVAFDSSGDAGSPILAITAFWNTARHW